MPQNSSITAYSLLTQYGLIRASGGDAATFLQGQLGNDVAQVNETQHQLNCYSNPKGRLLAIFRLFQYDGAYYLRMPRDILAPTLARLKMFVLMSKVTLEDVSDDFAAIGITGESANGIIESSVGSTSPSNSGKTQHIDGIHILRTPGLTDRFELYGERTTMENLAAKIQTQCPITDEDHWMHGDIMAGIPTIFENTREEFVAQMVNLQLIDAISFKKGCFPGQEIVARMKYLGKLKRRMFLGQIACQQAPAPGCDVFSADSSASAGKIVDARADGNGDIHALMSLKIDAAASGNLHLSAPDGDPITLQALPYTFDDE